MRTRTLFTVVGTQTTRADVHRTAVQPYSTYHVQLHAGRIQTNIYPFSHMLRRPSAASPTVSVGALRFAVTPQRHPSVCRDLIKQRHPPWTKQGAWMLAGTSTDRWN